MLIKDTNVTINGLDLNKAVSFYQSIGFVIRNQWNDHYAQVAAPRIVIGLHPIDPAKRSDDSGNVSIGFTTENFEETKAELQKPHVVFHSRDEEGGRFLHFNDPDGTSLYFIEPRW